MKKTTDWVVIYYDGHDGERQCTVITSQRGSLEGKRIVRGREEECAAYYKKIESGVLQSGNDRNNQFVYSIGIWD